MITVAGASCFETLDTSGQIVARTRRVLESPYLVGRGVVLDHTYDALFDGSLDDALPAIVDDLIKRSGKGDVVYLLPDAGVPGDVTVQALSSQTDVALVVGVMVPDSPVLGRASIVDALEIAIAEYETPFSSGLCPIDPTVPLLVTNWYGESVVQLALRRLTRVYGTTETEISRYEANGRLVIPPIDPLDAPGSIAALEHITARLRRPDGCPWDRDQTRESLLPQFIDELNELSDAINAGNVTNQREELGDVLFHVIAQCQLATEAGDFTFDDVLREITAKLVRRHPHVFGDVEVHSYDDVLATWNRVKAEEKAISDQNP